MEANLKSGNITEDDGDQLLELIYKLYSYILDNYEELGGSEDMRELLPGAMELPLDKYRKRIDELTQEKEEISKQNQEIQKQMENLAKKDKLTERMKNYTKSYSTSLAYLMTDFLLLF